MNIELKEWSSFRGTARWRSPFLATGEALSEWIWRTLNAAIRKLELQIRTLHDYVGWVSLV
jgi:hypothetical protein